MAETPTILVADDNPADRELVSSLLRDKDYRLVFAENGSQALDVAARSRPDLILLDVMMPDMDGFDVCRQIRQDPNISEVPIIMITALNSSRHVIKGIQVGADEFVSKPFNVDELRARIDNVIHLNRFRQLVNERKRFEWVVEHADDGYLSLNERGEITYANSQACKFLDVTSRPAPPFLDKFEEKAGERFSWEPQNGWALWMDRGSEQPPPTYLIRPAGEGPPLWLELAVLDDPLTSQKEALVRLRDVTRKLGDQRGIWTFHKLVEQRLKHPLNQLVHSVDGLHRIDSEVSFSDIQALVSGALDGTKQLYQTVDSVLKFVRAPEIARAGETFPLASVDSLLRQAAANLELDPIRWEHKVLEPIQLPLSELGLVWIFSEVLDNARKHHPRHKPVIHGWSGRQSNSVKLVIQDNGRRMSAQQLSEIGIPYLQNQGPRGGAGLGLAMIRTLMLEIGGGINVYNRDDKSGVSIELIFPLSASH